MRKKIKADEVRWGIIGVGDVCEVKSAPAMYTLDGSSLVAVMRRNGDLARDYAQRHGVPVWYDDAAALIDDATVNAVYIATPPSSHAQYTEMVAAAGKPVYVEKPMAITHAECQGMITACAEAGVPLYTAYYRRMLPNFRKVKSLLEDGAIGDVRTVAVTLRKSLHDADRAPSNWRVDPAVAGGGYFFDLASHQFDLLDYLFGPIAQVAGFAQNQAGAYKAEDAVVASFAFDSGILGTGLWSFAAAKGTELEETTIIGSEGAVTFPFFGAPTVSLHQDGKPVETFEFAMPKHIQSPLIETIIQDLQGTGTCPSTGVTAARTNWVLEQILRS